MVRLAKIEDVESVVEIYNQAIDARFQTGFMERHSVAGRMDWFRGHLDTEYPLFVCELDGKVVGWFSISPYRPGRVALRYSVEISYFVDNAYFGRGVGTQLVLHGVNACRSLGYKTAIAIIIDTNTASIKLMQKFGFEQWAFLPGVAEFDGVECNHVYYGLKL